MSNWRCLVKATLCLRLRGENHRDWERSWSEIEDWFLRKVVPNWVILMQKTLVIGQSGSTTAVLLFFNTEKHVRSLQVGAYLPECNPYQNQNTWSSPWPSFGWQTLWEGRTRCGQALHNKSDRWSISLYTFQFLSLKGGKDQLQSSIDWQTLLEVRFLMHDRLCLRELPCLNKT